MPFLLLFFFVSYFLLSTFSHCACYAITMLYLKELLVSKEV